MRKTNETSQTLAASITKAASKQTYYTIRLLVDRELVADAFQAYAYFRWVDDRLDQDLGERTERIAFVEQQQALVNRCYQGDWPRDAGMEERMLVDLIRKNGKKGSGLESYIRNMIAVMAFDARRRGRLITQEELAQYTRSLAIAVTEALHYLIGNGCASPRSNGRYLAATGAHITHMLRDTLDDNRAGYFNIPREVLESRGLSTNEVESQAYRAWVQHRAQLARRYFKAGKDYLAQVKNPRCRIAGYAYIFRFEGVLDSIERDGYVLKSSYAKTKRVGSGAKMIWLALASALTPRRHGSASRALPVRGGSH